MEHKIITSTNGEEYRLSKLERKWVSASSDPQDALLCIRYALLFTLKNPEWLLTKCQPDVEYISQFLDRQHYGLDNVSGLFEQRMSDPEWYPSSGKRPFVELATMPNGQPCCVHIDRTSRFDAGMGVSGFWMTFNSDSSGKINSMCSGCFPTSLNAEHSGIFPGVTAKQLRQEKNIKPKMLPSGVPLYFNFYHNDSHDWQSSAAAAKEVCDTFNIATFNIIKLDRSLNTEEDAVWLFMNGMYTLPHLQIHSPNERLLCLNGSFSRDQLMREISLRFYPPEKTAVKSGRTTKLLKKKSDGMKPVASIEWLYYCDPTRIDEILAAFQSDNGLAAQRAVYIMDRLSFIKPELMQPYKDILASVSHADPNIPKLRHLARMLPRLSFTAPERFRVEQLLFRLAWQQKDKALQVFALRSIALFSTANYHLREFVGSFVFDILCNTRNARVAREAERALDLIEYEEWRANALTYSREVYV